jgi:hypothetical protein
MPSVGISVRICMTRQKPKEKPENDMMKMENEKLSRVAAVQVEWCFGKVRTTALCRATAKRGDKNGKLGGSSGANNVAQVALLFVRPGWSF